jgi:hypothetical protein
MTKIKFTYREYVKKHVVLEIPNMELFKEKISEYVDEEGLLSPWTLEDEFSDVCDYKVVDEDVEEDLDGFLYAMDENQIPYDEESLQKYLVESES